jgi:hypothetical protein
MVTWRMAFRDGNKGPSLWPECHRLGVAAIEYTPLDSVDLSKHKEGEPKALWAKLAPTQKSSLRRLAYEMKSGDVIYVKEGPKIVGKGVVTGSYTFDSESQIVASNGVPWEHQVPVSWTPHFPELNVRVGGAQRLTVQRLRSTDVELIESAAWNAGGRSQVDLATDLSDIDSRAIDSTTRAALVDARLGQGAFRLGVLRLWNSCCCVTGSTTLDAIRASHIKPWRNSTDNERLDSNNGLPLVATLDALFDAGLISFHETSGKMLVSSLLKPPERSILGVVGKSLVQKPSKTTAKYLLHHRKRVYRP